MLLPSPSPFVPLQFSLPLSAVCLILLILFAGIDSDACVLLDHAVTPRLHANQHQQQQPSPDSCANQQRIRRQQRRPVAPLFRASAAAVLMTDSLFLSLSLTLSSAAESETEGAELRQTNQHRQTD